MPASQPGVSLARRTSHASLLALPAAMALGAPGAAQSVISTSHTAPLDLAAYGPGVVSIASLVSLSSTSWAAAWAAGVVSVANAGQVQAPDGVGILLGGGGSLSNTGTLAGNDAVSLGAAGSIGNSGVISAASYGVLVNGGAGSVSNSGSIAAGYDGVSLNRGGAVTNTGSIFGGHIGVYTGNGLGSVTNSGQISARGGDAVSLYSGGSFTNTAAGRLLGGYSGVYAGGDGSQITNAGLITGPDFGAYLSGASTISNSGTIVGGIDGVMDSGRGGVVRNAGLINGGSIGVRLARGGTVENSGTIAGLTGIAAFGPASIYDTGSLIATVGGDAIRLARGASTVTLGTGAVISGDIAGNGTASSLSLTGSGTLGTDITGFNNGALYVAPGAAWTGTGQWNVAQMVNAGSFTAGLAAVPLRLTGNFTQTSTGTLVVLVEPGEVSSFTVTGSITLGGTLTYVLAPGTYTPASYQFLQASAGLSGSFAQVAGAPRPVQVVLGPLAARLRIKGNFSVAPQGAALLPDTTQALAMQAESLGDTLLARAALGGGGAGCANTPAGGGMAGLAGALAGGVCAAGGWIEAAGSNLATGAYNLAGGGFLAGVDRAVPATGGRVGLAVGYDAATLRGKADGTAGLETLRLGLYASQPLGAAVLSAAVLDGIASLDTTRQTGAGAAVARVDGNALTAAMQLALPLRWRGVEATPAAGLRVTTVSLGPFAETAAAAAFALRGAAASGTAVTPFLRLDLGRRFVTASRIVITPRVTLGLDAALGTQGAGIGVTTRSGAGLELTPWRQGRVSGLTGLGLSLARGGWSVDFGYSGRFAWNWSAQSVQAAVSARF